MIIKPGTITNWDQMEEQVQFYRDHLDIFIEDAFPPITLNKTQHVIARAFGKCSDMKVVCSRGYQAKAKHFRSPSARLRYVVFIRARQS